MRFSGRVKILLELGAPTPYVVLHSRDARVHSAVAHAPGTELTATPTSRPGHGALAPDELVLAFPRPLPAGRVTLDILYDAPFTDGLAGLYRVSDGQRSYAFTQFEPSDARRAFPCFDEPGYKVPFDVTLRVPKGMLAVSNAPETSRTDDGARTVFRFATTRPLPSYLVAFAIGDFDVREGPASPVPIRLIAAKGRAGLGETAIAATAALVQTLGDYFGIPYPYPKLDLVAVPDFAPGAMENAGLITFRETVLLLDPSRATFASRRDQAGTIAHELAHQWFGDLVTMRWWNDAWLNEGFATWATAKAVDQWRPSFDAHVRSVAGGLWVMGIDGLRSARAVRQPVTSTSEALEAFDGITYVKGAAVLRMLEHYVGEAAFQDGVRRYLREHAWKNATADDLLRALDAASGKPVSTMAATFLDRSGVPVVSLTPTCSQGKVSLAVEQAPWHPLGVGGGIAAAVVPPRWIIPLFVRTPKERPVQQLLEPAHIDLATCPAWVHPNADQAGYYHFALDEKGYSALLDARSKLEIAERVGLVANMWAQVRAGTLPPDALLRALPKLDGETNPHVIGEEVEVLEGVSHALVDDAARPVFQRYVLARMLPHKRWLDGTKPKDADDTASRTLLRRTLVWALAELADDDRTIKEAEELTQKWLHDPANVDPDAAQSMVALASRRAGADRIEALRTAAAAAKTPQDRLTAWNALAGFDDPAVAKSALDVVLGGEVPTEDATGIVDRAVGRRSSQHAALEWIESHWDRLRAKLAGSYGGRFFGVPGVTCTKPDLDAASAFFSEHVREVEGAQRPLAEAIETARLCIALREHGAEAVSRYLAPRRP